GPGLSAEIWDAHRLRGGALASRGRSLRRWTTGLIRTQRRKLQDAAGVRCLTWLIGAGTAATAGTCITSPQSWSRCRSMGSYLHHERSKAGT
ncbi:hypothetical protein HaLaN_09894, partial [Haematococcus lacustris]